ncbi:hypothetical protein jhhlp_002754 [Lomentospora prolificans]|uniref:Carboxylic ester hydrolase n=1 Tax=Lomentospora prolificans TaxID=41688 RepID=A0A2N3NEZ2_9PEZI|nr:hypothetical protein jhhlp_002754 [Lomentospora prolificans]
MKDEDDQAMKPNYLAFEMLPALISLALVAPAMAVAPLVDLGYTQLQGVSQASGATQWLGVGYAAAPVGVMRFGAPLDPPPTREVVDVTQFKPICLPRSPNDFTMQPNRRFNVSEDCLYLNIFAPTAATAEEPVPVMYFVQGGGFESNSNANFNGSALAMFGDIMVVQVNYRVGPFGFLQSQEVEEQASLNNGLKDLIQGLRWLKRHVSKFGGDPNQIVIAGDSAGATSIALLLAAFPDEDPGLFQGAIMESVSLATIRDMSQGQEQYQCLVDAAGCSTAPDSFACLIAANASALQTENCQFNPHLDDRLIQAPMLTRFAEGKYLRVPTIAGSCTDEGTKGVPKDTDTIEAALEFVNNQASGALSEESLALIRETYLDVEQPTFNNSGRFWRHLATAHGDFRAHCVTAKIQDAQARDGVMTWNYRYGVLDEEQEMLGFGAYHTVELNGVFGPNNTDGAPPKSYAGDNAPIVPVTMAYWAKFVRSLDPNAAAAEFVAQVESGDMPEWMPWTTESKQRLLFQTGNTQMEEMPQEQQDNCAMLDAMLAAIETPSQESGSVQLARIGGGASAEEAGEPTLQSGGVVVVRRQILGVGVAQVVGACLAAALVLV